MPFVVHILGILIAFYKKTESIYGTISKIKDQISKISQKVDLPKLMNQFSKLDENQIKGLTKMLYSSGKKKELPPINGDFYELRVVPEVLMKVLWIKPENANNSGNRLLLFS